MSDSPSTGRFTIRVRLTLMYAAAFFVAGLTLVGLMYFQLGDILDQQLTVRAELVDAPTLDESGRGDRPKAGQTIQQAVPMGNVKEMVDLQFEYARRETLSNMFAASLLFLGFTGLVAGGFGWLMAGQFLRPLREITETARGVAGRSLHHRIALKGPNDEIKNLADTLDAMLERLDRTFDSQERFIANASHELRTPLTINRTLIEVEMLVGGASDKRLRELGEKLLEINVRHEKLIEGLLMLATSEQPLSEIIEIDLPNIVQHVVDECNGHAENEGVSIRTRLDPAVVSGDPVLVERVVQNLVENAIRYNNPQGGWISIHTATRNGIAIVSVENSGSIIAAHDVPTLLEPFRRLPGTDRLAELTDRPVKRGAGLGLSIVRAIAQAHGGSVRVSARKEGGLMVVVELPSRPEA